MTDQDKAIAAFKAGLLDQKITIKTTGDFTPSGKRNARLVQTTGVTGRGSQLRLHVSGRIYRCLAPTNENFAMAREWLAA